MPLRTEPRLPHRLQSLPPGTCSTPGTRRQGFPSFPQPLQVRAKLRRPYISTALYQPLDSANQFIQPPPGFLLDPPQHAIYALLPLTAEPAEVLKNHVGDRTRKMAVNYALDHPYRQNTRQQFPVPVEHSSDSDIGCTRLHDVDFAFRRSQWHAERPHGTIRQAISKLLQRAERLLRHVVQRCQE